MNGVGNQADAHKYCPPTMLSGAWKGEIMQTNQSLPCKSTTGTKWKCYKDRVKWVLEQADMMKFQLQNSYALLDLE
jgi:hypothetical protein